MEFLDDDIADVMDIKAWLDNCAEAALPGVGDGCDVVGIVPMKLNTGIEVAPTIVGRSEPGVGAADGLVQLGIVNMPAPIVPGVAVCTPVTWCWHERHCKWSRRRLRSGWARLW